MKWLLLIVFVPCVLMAFSPKPVTSNPVLGTHTISYYDKYEEVNREIQVWYPVASAVTGLPSKSLWDLFNVAADAPPDTSEQKRPVIVLSHGHSGNPNQLSWLIQGLVREGFIVIAIKHRDIVDGEPQANSWGRARDVHVILD